MSRKCQITGKKLTMQWRYLTLTVVLKSLQGVNLQWKRVWWKEGNRWVRLRLSTKAIKTLERRGIGAMAKEAGIDLNRY